MEKLAGIEVPERAEYLRVIMAEFGRIVNHTWSIGFILNDLGALQTPALYAIEEREMILDLFEAVSGARMMCNYMRFGGVVRDLPEGWHEQAAYLANERLPRALDELDRLLTENEILRARGRGVGYLAVEDLIALSVSGPMVRAGGLAYDIRKAEPYGIYDRFDFDVPTLPNSDIFDRYYIRLLEAKESVRILQQALRDMPEGEIPRRQRRLHAAGARRRGLRPPGSAQGRTGILSGQRRQDAAVALSYPFAQLHQPERPRPMSVGYKVADAIVILGAIDIVLGEVDR